MSDTLVIQSAADPDSGDWRGRCLGSVRTWSRQRDFDYRFIGDELFDAIDPALRDKTRSQPVIATDLARLVLLREALDAGYATAVWLDADFLIFRPGNFRLPPTDHAVGREVWVQADERGRLRVYRQVHNALLMARRGNSFLDFYRDAATRLLRANSGRMPAQFLGPKLLTALHNVVQLPVMESAAAFSPLVIRDLIAGGGPALQRLRDNSAQPAAGANLCASSLDRGELAPAQLDAVVGRLLEAGAEPLS